MTVDDLQKRLDIEKLPVYFLKGEDVFLRELAQKQFSALVDAEFSEFNLNVFDSLESISDIIVECITLPVFSDIRVVLVKGVGKFLEREKALLSDYLKNPAPETILVVVDDAEKSPLSALYKYGDVINCDRCSEAQVVSRMSDILRQRQQSMDTFAIRVLAEYTNNNMTRIMVELEKLCDYANGKNISLSMVELLVTPDQEYTVFKLTDAICSGKNGEALKIISSMLEKGAKPSFILATLQNQYRRMFEAKVSSLEPSALATALGVKPYAITSAKALAAKYTQTELKNIVDKLHRLEYAFKSGETDEKEALFYAVSVLIKKK